MHTQQQLSLANTNEQNVDSPDNPPRFCSLLSCFGPIAHIELIHFPRTRTQQKLGLDITDEQIAEIEANLTNIDYTMAAAEEKKRHTT